MFEIKSRRLLKAVTIGILRNKIVVKEHSLISDREGEGQSSL